MKELKQNLKLDEVDDSIHNLIEKPQMATLCWLLKAPLRVARLSTKLYREMSKKKVRSLKTSKIIFEVRDLDEATTTKEVVEALRMVMDGT